MPGWSAKIPIVFMTDRIDAAPRAPCDRASLGVSLSSLPPERRCYGFRHFQVSWDFSSCLSRLLRAKDAKDWCAELPYRTFDALECFASRSDAASFPAVVSLPRDL